MAADQNEETERLAALVTYEVLDTPPDPAFDNITRMCAELLDVPIPLVTMVDKDRQWFKSRIGLEPPETARSISFCTHAIRESKAFIVEDALLDARFADNPLVLGNPNIRFYAGAQLRTPEGLALGTLCAIDRQPRKMTERQIALLERLARQTEAHLELHRQSRRLEAKLAQADKARADRERLAAMVVHDLRNPIAGITLAALSAPDFTDAELRELMPAIATQAQRAQRMLADVMDVCLGSAGGLVPRPSAVSLTRAVADAVAAGSPLARESGITLAGTASAGEVWADADLLGRVLVNLIENAIRYSPRGSRVMVRAERDQQVTRFTVEDLGIGVPEEQREWIFKPYAQGSLKPGRRGLGLAFCKMAAEAHGGRVYVEANQPTGSRFICELPVQPVRVLSPQDTVGGQHAP